MTTLFTDARASASPFGARANGHQPPLIHPIQVAQWVERPIVKPTAEQDAAPAQPTVETAAPTAEQIKLDAELAKAVRQSGYMRQLFYAAVLATALGGQVSGAVEALGLEWYVAIGPVAALEVGAVVVLNNADVRRRLGERAVASRLLSAAISAGAVVFNWMAHANHLLGGFFAGMSALGYLVWLMHTENQRRDRLRAKGDLPPTTPAYEMVGHWLRHPWLTLRAKNLAKANQKLGLYSSIEAAKAEKRKERRTSAIAKVLHRKIRAAVDPTTADIAISAYNLDEVAVRLADGADYDGLTALIAADLTPARLAAEAPTSVVRVESSVGQPTPAVIEAPTAHTPTPMLEMGGSAHAHTPTQPTPTVGGDGVAQAWADWAGSLEPMWAPTTSAHLGAQPTPTSQPTAPTPTAQPTWAASDEGAHRGDAQPTPNLGDQAEAPTAQPTPTPPRVPKPPTKPTAVQPKSAAQGAHTPTPIPGLTDLQQSRLADLAREFPGDLPGRDKVMAHMREQGYQGWSSKEPAKTLINLLRAQRADAQPTAHAHTPTEGEQ
ncbi:hypothetical protein [Dactylosporangium salmoneum]|uniref:DUF2637 domain-containing protein n=1 Tax=Dactylosporangium salmoneum TaxID=53361 RepID=A0ABN3G9M7_9ACTN